LKENIEDSSKENENLPESSPQVLEKCIKNTPKKSMKLLRIY